MNYAREISSPSNQIFIYHNREETLEKMIRQSRYKNDREEDNHIKRIAKKSMTVAKGDLWGKINKQEK